MRQKRSHSRPVSVALLLGKDFQIIEEAGKARLQPELQVVLSDHQHQHGHEQTQESKGKTDRALATLFRAKVVAHQHVEALPEHHQLKKHFDTGNKDEFPCSLAWK